MLNQFIVTSMTFPPSCLFTLVRKEGATYFQPWQIVGYGGTWGQRHEEKGDASFLAF
jgi:hypothetical protein